MKKVVIFARVSSTNGTQDYERQINDLQTLASANNWTVEAVFAEKVSGAKKNTERIELMNMINYINSHNIHKVLVTELSRLGRDTLQVLQAIEILNQNKVSVFIQNYNIETLTPEGEINPMSQFASGYQNFRSNGGKVGRKVGYTKSDEAMREEYAEELRLLKRGYSLRNTSKLTGTSINTLRKLTQLT